MENKQLNDILAYLFSHWVQVGIVASLLCTFITARNKLRKEGFLTIGEVLLGVCFMALYVAGGWLTLLFLGMLLKDQFEELLKIKIVKTREYKTKDLLYKEGEDE